MSSNIPSVTSPPWSVTTKRIIALAVVALAYVIARQVNTVAWTSIVIAVVLAYLLSPIVTFFERRLTRIRNNERRRALSVVLTWLVVMGVLGLFIGLIVPATFKQLREFANELPDLIANTEDDLKSTLSKPITVGHYTLVPWDELERVVTNKDGETSDISLTTALQNTVLSMANPALGVLGGAVSFLLSSFFVLVMLFYLMRDGPRFVEYLVAGVPESYRGDVRRMLHELGVIWHGYLRGQLLLCFAIALTTYLAALILGLPQPLVLGIVAGFLEFIPNIGPTLALIPALLFALTTSSTTIPGLEAGFVFGAVVTLTYVGIQQLEAIFLVPRILGQSLDLHPFVVLVAILIGSSLAGVLGVVLAAPMVATLRLFVRYLRGKLLDEEVFPAMSAYTMQQRGLVYRLTHYLLSKRFPVMPVERAAAIPVERADSGESGDISSWAL